MIEDFKHMKWLPLAGGALLCVLGLTALVWPGRVAKILPLCIGAAILGLGLCEVASGFLAKSLSLIHIFLFFWPWGCWPARGLPLRP